MKLFELARLHPRPYSFETVINKRSTRIFAKNYWHYVIYISILYLIIIYLLQQYMKSRSAFPLKAASVFWNGILAFFSICVAIRGIPLAYFVVRHYPVYEAVCDRSIYMEMPQVLFWGALFSFSKIWELGDTFLIVLRKRKLMFLHWYHHVSVLCITWYGVYTETSAGVFLLYCNAIVHSIMYSYFTIKCMNIKIPNKIAMTITLIQILQMVIGFLVICWISWLLLNGYKCDMPFSFLQCFFILSLSYVILFVLLFYTSYIRRNFSNKKKN